MELKGVIKDWFDAWQTGKFLQLPITENFRHTSPFGTIDGKKAYINLVKSNQDKFLGYRFEIHDVLYGENNACVRYTGIQGDFTLDVSEWYYLRDGLIEQIVAYYNIVEIPEERDATKL